MATLHSRHAESLNLSKYPKDWKSICMYLKSGNAEACVAPWLHYMRRMQHRQRKFCMWVLSVNRPWMYTLADVFT